MQKLLASGSHEPVDEIRAVAARGKRIVDELMSFMVLTSDVLLANESQTTDDGTEKLFKSWPSRLAKSTKVAFPGTSGGKLSVAVPVGDVRSFICLDAES